MSKILCFDIESCNGVLRGTASMCSFGYVVTDERGNLLKQEDILINPADAQFRARLIKDKLAYPEQVFRRAPIFITVYPRIKQLIDSADEVIGFAIENDIAYLDDACRHYGLPPLRFSYFDVQTAYCAHLDTDQQIGLHAACEPFRIEFLEHRSDDDAYATAMLYHALAKSRGESIEEMKKSLELTAGNTPDGMKCYSEILIRKINAESQGNKRRLFDYHLNRLEQRRKKKGVLCGRKFHFDTPLRLDANARDYATKLYQLGGRCTTYTSADTVVYGTSEQPNYRSKGFLQTAKEDKKTVLNLEEFLALIGEVAKGTYHDYEILKKMKIGRKKLEE